MKICYNQDVFQKAERRSKCQNGHKDKHKGGDGMRKMIIWKKGGLRHTKNHR